MMWKGLYEKSAASRHTIAPPIMEKRIPENGAEL